MATMKTLNGYGFNATEFNGKTSDSYLLKTDTVANSADSQKLGGKAPEYYLQPRNLLDNSDFRNPVNQRGASGAYGVWGGYTIDRWLVFNKGATIGLTNDGINLFNGIFQIISADELSRYRGKAMTFAAMIDGVVYTASGIIEQTGAWHIVSKVDTACGSIKFEIENDNSLYAVIENSTKAGLVKWAALYEGSYTADTLPPYVPKGYAAELAECQRYFERLGSTFSERIGNTVYVVSGAKSFVCSLQCSRKRIRHPSVSFGDLGNYRLLLKDATNASTYSAASISSFDDITTQEPFISFRVNIVDAITQNSWIQLQRSDGATAAYIDVSADL